MFIFWHGKMSCRPGRGALSVSALNAWKDAWSCNSQKKPRMQVDCPVFKQRKILHVRTELRPSIQCSAQFYYTSGPGCSKLTTSLVNETLKFQTLISQICQYILLKKWEASLNFSTKNFSVFCYKVVKHLTSWPLNELVKLTMLWTTGPRNLLMVGNGVGS